MDHVVLIPEVVKALAVRNIHPAERLPPAVRALVLAQGPQAVPTLLEIIAAATNDPWPHHGRERYLAGNAATLLADLDARQAIEPLLDLLAIADIEDCECVSDVIWALGRFGRDVLAPTRRRYDATTDRLLLERLTCVLVATKLRSEETYAAILRIFDWDAEMAVSILVEYGDRRAIPFVIALLDTPDLEPDLLEILGEAAYRWDVSLTEAQARRLPHVDRSRPGTDPD